jgi:hypothetical protein
MIIVLYRREKKLLQKFCRLNHLLTFLRLKQSDASKFALK